MKSQFLERTLGTLKLMRQSEESVGEFYAACARRWDHDAGFWNMLAAAEKAHALKIEKMREMVEANPVLYVPGRPFNPLATETFIKWTKDARKNVESGDIFLKDALALAVDIERSLLESRFTDFLQTQDREYLLMVDVLRQETEVHIEMLKKRAEEHSVG